MSTNANNARRHHWVPQCYLKGFTADRNKNTPLFVVDGETKRSFRTPAANVAAQRDFNRVEIEGQHPNSIESALSGFETCVSDALDRIEDVGNISVEDDRLLVLNLIALLAVRNPRMRESIRGAREHLSEVIMDALLSSRERWSSALEKAKAAGYVKTAWVDNGYDEMRAFVEKGDYTIEVPTTDHVLSELERVDDILPYLVARKWTVFVAEARSGAFITCDHPVILKWDGTQKQEPRSPPGFALRGSEVVFPLSSRLALSGMFDGEEAVCEVAADMVALINGMVIENASRQVYAREDTFQYFLNRQNGVRQGSSLVDDVALVKSPNPYGSGSDP